MSFLEKNLTRQQLDYRVSVEALGHLRGRTFEDTVLICDEMQNASRSQFNMKAADRRKTDDRTSASYAPVYGRARGKLSC